VQASEQGYWDLDLYIGVDGGSLLSGGTITIGRHLPKLKGILDIFKYHAVVPAPGELEMPFELDMSRLRFGTDLVKRGFARMQQGGVIMDVTNAEQACIAEEAGAVAVMALERVPADIRSQGGVARMSDPAMIEQIIDSVTIPVMAKCRIGHFVEAQVLESLGVDMIDESEVLTPADPFYHVDKSHFTVPFVCGARDLGEALRRIDEGAAMIRTKGEAGTGNVVEAVRHQRVIMGKVRSLKGMDADELRTVAREIQASFLLVQEVAQLQRLPVINFAAGGIATPADAALMMQLGSDGVFVGSGIFKSDDPTRRAKAIVEAVTHYDDPAVIASISKNLGDAMRGIEISEIPADQRLQERGW
jgi:pyridoxal 5'-phosphate synthase pdxS subunit